jgi:hypothetical protein
MTALEVSCCVSPLSALAPPLCGQYPIELIALCLEHAEPVISVRHRVCPVPVHKHRACWLPKGQIDVSSDI